MNKLTVIVKASCAASKKLMNYLESLSDECKNFIGVLDEQTSSMSDLYKILDSYDTTGFPTIILHGKQSIDGSEAIISGFAEHTKTLLLNHLEC